MLHRLVDAGSKMAVGMLVVTVAMIFLSAQHGQAAYPERNIDFLISGSAGGGLDSTGRPMAKILSDEGIVKKQIVITNEGGGSGNVATAAMVARKGDSHAMYLNSNRVYLAYLTKTSPYSHRDLTTIARITSESPAFAVKSDSKYQGLSDVIADFKKNPGSVMFGIDSVPSNVQITILRVLKAAGCDIKKAKIIKYRGGGEMIAQLLGGHVSVICNSVSETVSHVEAGKMRLLGIASESRMDLPVLKNVPTFSELGYPVVVHHWRGVFGPPGMSSEARDYLIKALGKMVETPAWKKVLNTYVQNNAFLPRDKFVEQLDKESAQIKELLTEIGFIK